MVRERPPRIPVHPHGCGERYFEYSSIYCSCGSSPRLWGTRSGLSCEWSAGRFIPTAVGNAGESRPMYELTRVHPHGCGERNPRGNYSMNVKRFIPTAVGNADESCNQPIPRPVHPHGCGERILVLFV